MTAYAVSTGIFGKNYFMRASDSTTVPLLTTLFSSVHSMQVGVVGDFYSGAESGDDNFISWGSPSGIPNVRRLHVGTGRDFYFMSVASDAGGLSFAAGVSALTGVPVAATPEPAGFLLAGCRPSSGSARCCAAGCGLGKPCRAAKRSPRTPSIPRAPAPADQPPPRQSLLEARGAPHAIAGALGRTAPPHHTSKETNPMETPLQNAPPLDLDQLVRQGGRLRQMVDGRWLAEERHGWWIFVRWIAIDLNCPRYLWKPSERSYKNCLGTREEAIAGLAMRGFSLPNRATVRPRPFQP